MSVPNTISQISSDLGAVSGGAFTASEPETGTGSQTYQQILYPTLGLPDNILREILLEWHRLGPQKPVQPPEQPKIKFTDSLDTTLPQWVYAQVCRSWRQAAFSCKALWTRLGILMPGPDEPEGRKIAMIHNLNSLLRWLGDLPLKVKIKSYHPFAPDDILFTTICSSSSRWEMLRLALHFEEVDVLQNILLSLGARMPQVPLLHSLSLDFMSKLPSGIDTFLNVSNLRRVDVGGKLYDTHRSLEIPWNQITEYRRLCDEFGDSASEEHLMKMPNVVSYCDAAFSCSSGSPIPLPHLQVMKLSIGPMVPLDFGRLELGNHFTEFRLRSRCSSNKLLWSDSLVLSLHRWGCSLQTLYLDSCAISESKMILVFEHLTALRSLVFLYRQTLKSNLIGALANVKLLPHLYHLALDGHFGFMRDDMVKMLSARMIQGDSVFRKFGLPSSRIAFFAKDLECFREQGLEVESTRDTYKWNDWVGPQELED
ncbi:hypothetical protein VNI00_003051 [Paramarasmius palmivorus]|uniref:F-box domain-containing protein n=1 Tax=Paramarasmius palmivorus TaxID=297713 RepID=A0AAW0E133_9AGAR